MIKIDYFFNMKTWCLVLFFVSTFSITSGVAQTLVCNAAVLVSPDSNDEVTLLPDHLLSGAFDPALSYFVTILEQDSIPVAAGFDDVIIKNASQYSGDTLLSEVRHLASGNKCWGTVHVHGFTTFGCDDHWTITADANDQIRVTPKDALDAPHDNTKVYLVEILANSGGTVLASGTNEAVLNNASNHFGNIRVRITETASNDECESYFFILNPNPGGIVCTSTFEVIPDNDCQISFNPIAPVTSMLDPSHGHGGIILNQQGEEVAEFSDYFFGVDISGYETGDFTLVVFDTNDGDSCSTRLIVNDTIPPVAGCDDLSGEVLISGASYSVGRFSGPNSDNCGVVNIAGFVLDSMNNPLDIPKSRFSVPSVPGTYDAEVQFTDEAGNVSTCRTTFSVQFPSTSIVCNQFIYYSTDDDCEVTFEPDHWLEGLMPTGNFDMTVDLPDGRILQGIDSIHFLDAVGYLNDTISFNIQHLASGESCSGILMIEDKLVPIAVCDDTLKIVASTDPFVDYILKPSEIDDGSYDNCGLASMQVAELNSNGDPMTPPMDSISIAAWAGLNYLVELTVTDASGNENSCVTVVHILPSTLIQETVSGVIFEDTDASCTMNGSEVGSGGWNLAAVSYPSNSFSSIQANTDGSYAITHSFPPTDTLLKVYLLTPMNLTGACPNTFCHDLRSVPPALNFDFAIQTQLRMAADCPKLEVDISPGALESCELTDYIINYCNYGTGDANDAKIEVTFDELLDVIESDLTWTSVDGNTYTFDLGTVEKAACGEFKVRVNLSCDAQSEEAILVEAEAFPKSQCVPNDPTWSGASIEVEGECIGDSIVFVIRNVGDEDMIAPLNFIVIEDVILHKTASFDLLAQSELRLAAHGKGNTCRLEAEQVPGHPGKSFPSVTVEGCGVKPDGTVSRGFHVQFPEDDDDFFVEKDVREVKPAESFEMSASPRGVESRRFLKPNRDIEYYIRFSNWEDRISENMEVILDVSEHLNMASIIPGTSSHDYRYEVSESGEVKFIFDKIYLGPNESEAAFFKFTVSQNIDLANGTNIFMDYEIHNGRGNYFNPGNSPWHVISTDFLLSSVNTFDEFVNLKIAPNPFAERVVFEMQGIDNQRFTLKLIDVNGRLVRTEVFENTKFEMERNGLSNGLYFFTILSEKGMPISAGKLSVN